MTHFDRRPEAANDAPAAGLPAAGGCSRAPLPRLRGVDALRACAALLVLLLHTGRDTGPLAFLKPVAAFGWSGVGLFLVISGFSIHYRWAASERPDQEFSARRFLRRRFVRLYPTYGVAFLVIVLVLLALGISLHQPVSWALAPRPLPGWAVAISTVLVIPANLVPVAFVGVAWSLGLELQLYLVYAGLIRRLRRIGVLRVVFATLAIALAYRLLSQVVTSSMPVGQFFSDGQSSTLARLLYAQLPARAFEWFLGVLAAEAFLGRVRLPRWTRSPLAAAALILLAGLLFRWPLGAAELNGHQFRVSDVLLDPLVGLGYFVLLLAVVSRERTIASQPIPRVVFGVLAPIGVFSYSLYLLHYMLLAVGDRLAAAAGIAGAPATLLVWAFVLLGAWVFYRVVERPLITGRGERWMLARWRALRRIDRAVISSGAAVG